MEYSAVQVSQTEDPLTQHSCSYCGIQNVKCLIKCNACQKWFCNWNGKKYSSHIIMHLTHSNHREVTLHREGLLGEICFKCSVCGCQNVFMLGYVDEKISPSTDWFCRLPCSTLAKKAKHNGGLYQRTSYWNPLIIEHVFINMVVNKPSEDDVKKAKPRLVKEIKRMEKLWRVNVNAVFADLILSAMVPKLERVALRYESAQRYRDIFSPLIEAQADYDRYRSMLQSNVNSEVRWEFGRGERIHAFIKLEKFGDMHLMYGNRISLECAGIIEDYYDEPWSGVGYVFKLPKNLDKVVGVCFNTDCDPPMSRTHGFTVTCLWNPTVYIRMQKALQKFQEDKTAVSVYIYRRLLGHDVEDVRFRCRLPTHFSAPNLPTLNESQASAVRRALQQPVSVIQGPPGTGKTVTSASIIYHLALQKQGQILVCAPSNTAVDHLAEKISMTGLKVIRLFCKSREALESTYHCLSLHYEVRNMKGQTRFKELQQIVDENGTLTPDDDKAFRTLLHMCEQINLKAADVICCTCSCADDPRLEGFKFNTVLIDESTQATEPECLIPIVKGAAQIILVGDHCQLGPVVTSPKATNAGLGTSLFQRFLVLGSRSCVLNQQYRMHPELSKFPSNIFYEGALKDGISATERQCTPGFPWPSKKPMFFYAISGIEEISGTGISLLNRMEACIVEEIVVKFLACGVKSEQIGIITPYDGQKNHILQYLQHRGFVNYIQCQELEVSSVDGFQGREKDFIILSCVRSNKYNRVGFLNDPRRLNVAITRARYGLVILGDAQVLAKQPLWNHLLTYYQEQNVLVEGPLDNLRHCDLQFNKPPQLINQTNPENHFMDLAAFDPSSAIIPGNFSNSNNIAKKDVLPSHTDDVHNSVSFTCGPSS